MRPTLHRGDESIWRWHFGTTCWSTTVTNSEEPDMGEIASLPDVGTSVCDAGAFGAETSASPACRHKRTAPLNIAVRLPWALNIFTSPTGYIPATAQETLLTSYLGERGAVQAACLADQWQAAPAPPPAQHPPPTPPAQHPPPPSPQPSSPDTSSTSPSESTSTSSSPSASPRPPPPTMTPPPAGNHFPSLTPHQLQQALPALDTVDANSILQLRPSTYRSPPTFLWGPFRAALSTALTCILEANTDQQRTRAWTLWCLLPQMLLHRDPNLRPLPKNLWRDRFVQFQRGNWQPLLQGAIASASPQRPPTEATNSTASPPQPKAESQPGTGPGPHGRIVRRSSSPAL